MRHPRCFERHARRIRDPRVTRQIVDLFTWEPPGRYDLVTFAFWLSHVPPARFGDFWSIVRRAVEPGGVVFFVDEDQRGMGARSDPAAIRATRRCSAPFPAEGP